MRLLSVHDFRFAEFYEYERPSYAILSHCWAERKEEEVSFRELDDAFKDQDNTSSGLVWSSTHWVRFENRTGFWKIQNCCKRARERGIDWVWIDTCCIDKTSSAELTEAINSMYRWYEEATECYTYMMDVVWKPIATSTAAFCNSRWFQRGWTLQELLAPNSTLFFDREWLYIGNKHDLASAIYIATGISSSHLHKRKSASIATKMSWASRRITRRPEDIAYCLLGIFDVNMALLYGEGRQRAFIRLQLEIIRKSDDESIFAWTSNQRHSGMLASCPSFFEHSGDIQPGNWGMESRLPYSMTNKGLEFHVPTISGLRGSWLDNSESDGPKPWLHPDKEILLALNCWRVVGDRKKAVAIILHKGNETWYRTECRRLELRNGIKESFNDEGVKTTRAVYIRQDGM